jgi:hypothetical protein
MAFKEAGCDNVGEIFLARDRVQWRALVGTVMNFLFP